MDESISKEQTVNAIIKKIGIKNESFLLPSEKTIIDCIKIQPSVQPKTGKWIKEEQGLTVTSYRCSECGRSVRDDTGYDVSKDYPFCHCGAKMEVQDD